MRKEKDIIYSNLMYELINAYTYLLIYALSHSRIYALTHLLLYTQEALGYRLKAKEIDFINFGFDLSLLD